MKKITINAIMVITFLSCNQQTVDTKTEGEKLMNLKPGMVESGCHTGC